MAQIKQTGGRPKPTFLFAHILLPHEPYVFDADGRCLSLAEMDARGPKAGYDGQLRYANTLLKDVLAGLLDRPGGKPSSSCRRMKGPFLSVTAAARAPRREADQSELQTKTGILNAYYFPDGDYRALYDAITPVNSFRVVFNKFFGTNFERLP